jgi:hypothetical protein
MDWDAGRTIVEHRSGWWPPARSAGDTPVATISTKGIAVAESVDIDLVEVTVTVTDGGSKYVMGLPQRAFRVYEDGRSQAITHFSSENVALDLVLAVDISGSMRESMPKMKTAVKEFLTAVSATDRVTLLGFNDTIFPLARKSSDPVQRVKASSVWRPGATRHSTTSSSPASTCSAARPDARRWWSSRTAKIGQSHIGSTSSAGWRPAASRVRDRRGPGIEGRRAERAMDRLARSTGAARS